MLGESFSEISGRGPTVNRNSVIDNSVILYNFSPQKDRCTNILVHPAEAAGAGVICNLVQYWEPNLEKIFPRLCRLCFQVCRR